MTEDERRSYIDRLKQKEEHRQSIQRQLDATQKLPELNVGLRTTLVRLRQRRSLLIKALGTEKYHQYLRSTLVALARYRTIKRIGAATHLALELLCIGEAQKLALEGGVHGTQVQQQRCELVNVAVQVQLEILAELTGTHDLRH